MIRIKSIAHTLMYGLWMPNGKPPAIGGGFML